MESSEQIEHRAAQWLARRDSGDWTGNDQAELDRWIKSSIAHRIAFIRLQYGWQESLRLNALAAGRRPGSVPPRDQWSTARFHDAARDPSRADAEEAARLDLPQPKRHGWLPRALAATLVLTIAAVLSWYLWPTGSVYTTPIGGIAAVPLSDGSRITLNTDSAIRVAVTDTERRVELRQGEAFFEVARDPTRPFVVSAGDKLITVVGTRFSVRRDGDDIRLFVTEGRVRVEDASRKRVDSGTAADVIVSAGSIARTGGAEILVQDKSIAEVENHLSWRNGYLMFDRTTLADAVAEFNRYNQRRIIIEDPAVAAIRVSGKFRPTSFEIFVRLLDDGYPIDVRNEGGDIILEEER